MDIFKFGNPNAPLQMESAEVIEGFTSKLWIERYRDAGEFTLTAPVGTDLITKLPIGSFISHADSTDIMIVENHEINESESAMAEIKITGRSFETILGNRIVGDNRTFPISAAVKDCIMATDYTWNQIYLLLLNHTLLAYQLDPNNEIPNLSILTSIYGIGDAIAAQRTIPRKSLYDATLELLAIDNLGIRAIRPGPTYPALPVGNTAIVIHNGHDKTGSVVFAWDSGEIASADYLWSNKALKNAALISGKWVEVLVVSTSYTKANRRMMFIDGTSFDSDQTVAPTGATFTTIAGYMTQRASDILAAQTDVEIAKVEVFKGISGTAGHPKYRTDYILGDLVTVKGNYNTKSKFIVTEYVEVDDGTNVSGYPTLTLP